MKHTITVFIVFFLCSLNLAEAASYANVDALGEFMDLVAVVQDQKETYDPNALGEFMDLVNEIDNQKNSK